MSIRINQHVGLATLAVFFAALAARATSASAQASDDIFVVDEVLLTHGVSTFAASGDGSMVVALQRRGRIYEAILFNRTTHQRRTLVNDARSAGISADGSLVAVLTDEQVLVFNTTGAVVGSIAAAGEGWSTAIAGSANQLAIVYLDEIVIHDLVDGSVVFRWPYSWANSICCRSFVGDISMSDDGNRLLVTRVNTVRNRPTGYQNIVFDVESGTEFEFVDEATSPGAMSADGSTVAWVSENNAGGGRLEAIDLATGESQVLERSLAFDEWTYHPATNRVALSVSGDVVAFATTTALSPFDQALQVPAVGDAETTSSQDAYIWDRTTGSVTFASVPADGNTARRQVIGELHLVDDASQLVLGRHGRLEVAVPLAVASLTCGDLPVTVNLLLGDTPTNGDDVIFGTPIDDRIDGGPGNDVVCTGSGNDIIRGGEVVYGGNGNDVIRGTSARDLLFGDGGRDRIFGGKGRDLIRGAAAPTRSVVDRGSTAAYALRSTTRFAGARP